MNEESHILSKIEHVMQTFRETEGFAENDLSKEALIREIEKFDSEFKSVGYEASSMCIAKACFEKQDGELSDWKTFFSENIELYESQLLTGLGWAIAATNNNPVEILKTQLFTSFQKAKVFDGFGYYFGLFRSRLTIRSTDLPDILSNNKPFAFDSGLGRAIYYLSKGNPEMISKFISPFQTERLNEIWMGIGTACVFVGGFNEIELKAIAETAGENKKDFLIGGLFSLKSRTAANAETEFTMLFITTFFDKASIFKVLSEIELLKNEFSDYRKLVVKIKELLPS